MATMEQGLYARLIDVAGVTAIIGTRVYPVLVPPDGSYPCVVYTRISGPRVQIMAAQSGVAHPRFQINCWATTYTAVKDLAEQVRLALGSLAATWGSVSIKASIVEDDSDVFEQFIDNTGKRLYGVRMDFEIWHDEATS